MITITFEAQYVGPVFNGRKPTLKRGVKEKAFARYQPLIEKITGWKAGKLKLDVAAYLQLAKGDGNPENVIMIYHPDEIEDLSGERYWAVDYGNIGTGETTTVRLPENASLATVIREAKRVRGLQW